MHSNQRKTNNTPVPDGNTRLRPHKMRITFETDGTWFEIQTDRKDGTGFNLHVATDGDCGELTIQSDNGDEAFSALRIYRDRPT